MNKTIIGFIGLALASPVMAEKDFYGEFSLGSVDNQSKFSGVSNYVDSGEEITEYSSFKESGDSSSFGIRGGYLFNKNFALELGYVDNGDDTRTLDDSTSSTISTNAVKFGVKGILPISPVLSLNTRLGLAGWNLETQYTDPDFPDVEKESGSDFYYGIGAEYMINNQFKVGVEYSSLAMNWDVSESGLAPNGADYSYQFDLEHRVNTLSLFVQMKF